MLGQIQTEIKLATCSFQMKANVLVDGKPKLTKFCWVQRENAGLISVKSRQTNESRTQQVVIIVTQLPYSRHSPS